MSTTDLATAQAHAREALTKLIPLAIDTLSELAVGAERDNVRLAAAEAILDRVGMGRSQNVNVSTSAQEHQIATTSALEMLAKLDRNREQAALVKAPPALDVLVVLEGDSDELPVGDAHPGAIEASAT